MDNDNGRLYYGTGIDNSQLKRDADESKRILHGIGQTAKQEGDAIDNSMKKIGAAVAGYFAVSTLKNFAMQVAKVRGEFQQLEISFNTMLGSKREADALMSQLIKTAAITPFNMSDVAGGAKQLLAYGTAADEVNETLTRLGDIAAGLSLPLSDLVYLYGTTMTQGRMFTQDLRQFMGRGIPLAEELAKQFGVTKDKVGELVTAGKVGAEEFKAAIWSMSDEGSKFGGLMEAQSKSITGQISNLEDAVEQMINNIGKQSEGVISDVLSGASWVVENYEAIAKAILPVIAAYGAYKAALLAVWAVQKIEAIGQTALAFLQLTKYVTSAKDAMLLFNMATSANPIGLIAGVVAAAAAAFHLFNTETSKSAVLTQKFGESAAQTITRVNTLNLTLRGLTQGTSTYQKAVDELNGILKEYGVTQIEEGDNIDVVNEKREQAIELIKREAIERQRANNLAAGDEEYNKGIEDARAKLYSQLQNAFTDKNLGLFNFVSGNKELQENAAEISNVIADVVSNNISKIAGKTGDEYKKGLDEIFATIQDRMRAMGISEETISKQWLTDGLFNHTNIVKDFIGSLQQLEERHDSYIDHTNKAAEAERQAAEATMTFDDRVAATGRSLAGASDDVHTLYKNIKDLMSKYSDNTIGFKIKFSGEVPKWMHNVPIEEVKRLAKFFSSLGNTLAQDGKGGAFVSGKWMTTEQILQQGAYYAQEGENRQNAAEKAQRDAEANKKERERAAKAAAREAKQREEQRKREQQQIADQTADRLKAIDQYNDSVAKATEQAELDIRQRHIETLEEGFEKEKLQINLNYDRLIAENERREQEMLEALADNKLNEWLNKNPKATKQQQLDYRNSLFNEKSDNYLTRADLLPDQRKQLEQYENVANEIKAKAEKDLYKRLLDEYQDYNTRRQNEDKEYAKNRKALEEAPIDPAERDAALAELERKHKKAIQDINNEEVEAMQKSSTLLVDLFSDASEKSDKQLRKLITDTQALLDYLRNTKTEDITPQFGFTADQLKAMKASPEQIKAIQEEIKKLNDIVRGNNPFRALAEDIKKLLEKPKDGEKIQDLEVRLEKFASSAAGCADIIGGLTSKLSQMFDAAGAGGAAEAMESVTDVMNTVSNIGKGFAEGGLIGGIAAAAGEAIGYVTKAFQANARHKEALKQVLKEVTAQQRAYTLALLEENLQMERASTIFGNLDYMKAANSVYVMLDAYSALRKEIEGTVEQQEKFAQPKMTGVGFIDDILRKQYSALKDAYSGLADISIKTGHKKTGLFGWGKGKDIYSSILDVYPELIDGQGHFNKELAQTILETREFEGEGKEALQYMIDLAEKAEEAYNQVKDYLTGIFGELGNTISDALVDAFINGTDAAEAFGKSVADMLENLGKQMIFSTLFGSLIQQANDEMLAVMTDVSKTEEEKFNEYVNILDQMTTGILGQQDNYNALMERYKQMAADKGVTIFDEDTESRQASQKGIASASQDSIDELNGRMTAVQGHTFSISQNTEILVGTTAAILRSVMGIEANTDPLPDSLRAIESGMETVEQGIRSVRETVSDIALKGVKIRT